MINNNDDKDSDNPYKFYKNTSVIKYDKKFDGEIIDIKGNIFNFIFQQNIVMFDVNNIKEVYNALFVIEIILQKNMMNMTKIDTTFLDYYPELNNIYNIFVEQPNDILIQMLLWLTFILNTGWFYVDLENDQDPNSSQDLYKDLRHIEEILMTNMIKLFSAFINMEFNEWNTNWTKIIQQIKGKIHNQKLLSYILDSHISNLFTFNHINGIILLENINAFILDCRLNFENHIVKMLTYKSSPSNTTQAINARKKLSGNITKTRRVFSGIPTKGGHYTKHKKAIKRNKRRYSIKKKYKKTKKRKNTKY